MPVLLKEVVESLELKSGMNIIDCTLGDGGHSEQILEATAPQGKLLGIDADPESLLRAKKYLHRFGDRVLYVRSNFSNLAQVMRDTSFGPVNGVIIDLGWSSPQFEERGRGFSFQNKDEPLDMRYDVRSEENGGGKTAADIVNTISEEELERLFREYGEEQAAKDIAKAIVEQRKKKKFERVGDLVDAILAVFRKKLGTNKEVPWVGGLHPATKIFQALRIAVNDELGVIEKVLPEAVAILAPGGRLAVITFHSLEDRIVKHFFKAKDSKTIRIITKKPITAGEEEHANNPRARSAKLRVIEKL